MGRETQKSPTSSSALITRLHTVSSLTGANGQYQPTVSSFIFNSMPRIVGGITQRAHRWNELRVRAAQSEPTRRAELVANNALSHYQQRAVDGAAAEAEHMQNCSCCRNCWPRARDGVTVIRETRDITHRVAPICEQNVFTRRYWGSLWLAPTTYVDSNSINMASRLRIDGCHVVTSQLHRILLFTR